jgi:hypothetical protein
MAALLQAGAGDGKEVKVVRHGKPSKAYTSRLRGATSADWATMVSATVEAIVGGSEDVLALFPYTMKFPKDFPKGILEVKREDGANVHRIKAKKLLKWLQDHGHTEITMDTLRGQIISNGLMLAAFDEMCEFSEETWQAITTRS